MSLTVNRSARQSGCKLRLLPLLGSLGGRSWVRWKAHHCSLQAVESQPLPTNSAVVTGASCGRMMSGFVGNFVALQVGKSTAAAVLTPDSRLHMRPACFLESTQLALLRSIQRLCNSSLPSSALMGDLDEASLDTVWHFAACRLGVISASWVGLGDLG